MTGTDFNDLAPEATREIVTSAMQSAEHEGDDPWAAPKRPKVADFVLDGEEKIEAPVEIIKRCMPSGPGFLAFIAGQSQAGKTFVMAHQAVCMAAGIDFFGFPVRERVGSIIVAAEGQGAISRRLKVAREGLGVEGPLPIAVIKRKPNIADKKQREALIADLKRVGGWMVSSGQCSRIGAIYLDTVTACVVMQDENGNAEISVVCEHFRAIGRALDCNVAGLIHMGKSDAAGIRGGSNWTGHADLVLSVLCDREKDGTAKNRRVAITKSRDGEEGPLSGFELRYVELGRHPEFGDSYGSCMIEPCEADWTTKAKTKDVDRGFEIAFNDVAATCVTQRKVAGDGPMTRCVNLQHVRNEFMRRYTTGEGKDKTESAARQAWSRALKSAKATDYAAEKDSAGTEWIWCTKSQLLL